MTPASTSQPEPRDAEAASRPSAARASRWEVTLLISVAIALVAEWAVMKMIPLFQSLVDSAWLGLLDALVVGLIVAPAVVGITLHRHGHARADRRVHASPSRVHGMPPWAYAAGTGALFFIVAAACLYGAHRVADGVLKETVDEDLGRIAAIAANSIDPIGHAALADPKQQNGPEYLAVVAPLRRLLASTPHVKYIYTVRASPEGPRFVVDAAEPIDGDNDGVIDQSGLNELYEDPDEAMLSALARSESAVSSVPYTDKWGTFISAFAPVRAPDGRLECIVGVDMTAGGYMARVAVMDRALAFGGVLVLVASVGVALLVIVAQTRRQGALRSLVESESLLNQVASAAPVMLWMVDEACTPFYFSKAWLEFTGRDLEHEITGVASSIHEEDRAAVSEEFRRAFEERRPFEMEFRLRRADGQHRWVLSRGMPRHGADGAFLGFVGGAIDVTERHEAARLQEVALSLATKLASAGNVSEAAKYVNDTLAEVASVRRSAVLLYGDDGVCRFVGWRGLSETYRRAVEGHCPWPANSPIANAITVDDCHTEASLERYRDLFAAEGIRSLAFVPVMTELGVAGKVMLYFDEPRGMNAERMAAATTMASYLGMTVGRLVSRERLEASEQRVRTVIDTALEAVVAMDSRGVVTDWNAAAEKTFGWSKAEAIGRSMARLIVPEEMRDQHTQGIKRFLTTGEMRILGKRIEVPACRRDGSRITVELSISPVHTSNGVHFSAFLRDVTEKKKAEAELLRAKDAAEAASRSKSEFLANMSHEIRTPMTAILGFADLLQEDSEEMRLPERRNETVATIKRHGEALLTIINDILDLSKIEAGKMEVERIECSAEAVVEDVMSLMRVRAAGKGLTLELVHETPIPEKVRTDPTRMRQILINLVGNSLKFTEHGGVAVTMGCDPHGPAGPMLRFEIADTGVGMTPEQLGRLFKPFEQGDASTTRKFGGTGLGLQISKRLAALLGGEIEVRSEVGRGSVFAVTIATGSLDGVAMVNPATIQENIRTEEEARAKAKADEKHLEAGILRGLKVLLVEDGIDNQRLISHHLRKAGAEVATAGNGLIALDTLTLPGTERKELLRPCQFDLVLMDMQMPELDGYSATRRLRAMGFTTPIVALTAHAMSGDREKCLAAGCDGYATKPINKAALLQTCREMVDRGHSTARAA